MITELKVKQGTSLGHIFWVYFFFSFLSLIWHLLVRQLWASMIGNTTRNCDHPWNTFYWELFISHKMWLFHNSPLPRSRGRPLVGVIDKVTTTLWEKMNVKDPWLSVCIHSPTLTTKKLSLKRCFISKSSSKKRRSIFPSAPSYTTSPLSLVLMTISHTMLNRTNMGECLTMCGKVFR